LYRYTAAAYPGQGVPPENTVMDEDGDEVGSLPPSFPRRRRCVQA
jgi:hypothetical protein